MPAIAHLPVILSPSGRGKLSKRDQAFQDGDSLVLVKTLDYPKAGYLAEAVVNFLANVGWSYGDDVEMFAIDDAVQRFDITSVNPAPTQLPFSKLEWLNGQYIQQMEPLELAKAIKPFLDEAGLEVNIEALLALAPVLNVRLKRLSDAVELMDFLDDAGWDPDPARLTHKKIGREAARQAYTATHAFIAAGGYDLEQLGATLREIGKQATGGSPGPFLGTLRYAITGQQVSPPLFESMMALGQMRVLQRLDSILERIT
jgi:glutamyl-tRNA synthetase